MKQKIDNFLDNNVLPLPVKFLTNRYTIIITFLLLIPLLFLGNFVSFVLFVNSYLNVTSVGVSSIVLRETNLTAERIEQRAEQDHQAIQEQFKVIKQMQNETHEIVSSQQLQIDEQHEVLKMMHIMLQEMHEIVSKLK